MCGGHRWAESGRAVTKGRDREMVQTPNVLRGRRDRRKVVGGGGDNSLGGDAPERLSKALNEAYWCKRGPRRQGWYEGPRADSDLLWIRRSLSSAEASAPPVQEA